MHTILISENPMLAESWERHDVESVNGFIQERWPSWPETARVYRGAVSLASDVTPTDEASALRLEAMEEPLWIAVYPGTGIEIAAGVTAVLSIVSLVAAVLLIPDPPNVTTARDRQVAGGSPNNRLTGRSNSVRLDGRIPDNYGRVKSVPDLVQVPLVTWENNREFETSLMCIGVGEYEIDADQILDGDTPANQIPGNSVHVYEPGSAPTGAGPHTGTQIAIGPAIPDPVLNVFEVGSFNGQELVPFNANTIYGLTPQPGANSDNTSTFPEFGQDAYHFLHFRFDTATTGTVFVPVGKGREFVLDKLDVGDRMHLDWVVGLMPPSTQPAPDLNSTGTGVEPDEPWADSMVVTAIAPTNTVTTRAEYVAISVSIPAALQPAWADFATYADNLTFVDPFAADNELDGGGAGQQAVSAIEAFFTTVERLFVGPFVFDNSAQPLGSSDLSVFANIVARQGLTEIDKVNIVPVTIDVRIAVTPSDPDGTLTGPTIIQEAQIVGSESSPRNQRGITIRFDLSGDFDPGQSFVIRALRATNRRRTNDLTRAREIALFGGERAYSGTITDEIVISHVYVVSKPPNISFGDVTLVHSRVAETVGRTAPKSRELNLTAFRMIQTWDGATFGGPLVANDLAHNVLFSLMKDPFVGNLPDEQIDFPQIADTIEAVSEYFDAPIVDPVTIRSTAVSYTFDDSSTSFEESVLLVAAIAFCTVYRQGNLVKVISEISTDQAEGVFNHRNILPGSESITHSFGPRTENDSVEVDWLDPLNGRTSTVTVPTNFTATPSKAQLTSPRTVRVPGLSTEMMAYTHAWRAFQKMEFQRQALDMEATAEAGELVVKSRVLIADTTQQDSQQGEILEASGVQIKVSQEPDFLGGGTFTIFLFHANGTVEALPATPGAAGFDIALGSLPSQPLRTVRDDANDAVPTIYNLVRDQDAMPSAYLVSEKNAQSNFVFQVTAINYTDIYYMADSLNTFISRTPRDDSPRQLNLEITGSIGTVADATRGQMLSLTAAGSLGSTLQPFDLVNVGGDWSYFVWFRPANNVSNHRFIGTEPTTGAVFFEMVADHIEVGTDNTLRLSSPANLNAGQMYHFGCTFSGGTLRIFVDGNQVAEATGVPGPTGSNRHVYFDNCSGSASELMFYRRALTPQAVADLFRKTLILTPPS